MLAVGGSAWIRLCPRFPEAHRARFNEAAVGYLEHRTNLCLVFALIDSSLAPQKIDLEFVEWLVHHAVPFVLVFTKADKVPAVTAQVNLAAFTDRISPWFEMLPAVFTSSAETGQGRQELLGVIDEYGNISVWFHTTAKSIKEIKKIEPGRFIGRLDELYPQ